MSLAGVQLTRPNHNRLLNLAPAKPDYRFAVALPGVSVPLTMLVMIEEIRYTPSGAPLVNEVGADLALKALCRNAIFQPPAPTR